MLKRTLMMLVGFVIVAFGSYLSVEAAVAGVSPWIAAYMGLTNIGLTVGIWAIICQFIFIAIAFLVNRKIPKVGTFVNMVFTSLMIDFFIYLNLLPDIHSFTVGVIVFLVGSIIIGFGMAVAAQSKLGPGARTELSLALKDSFNVNVKHSSFFIEVLGIIIAFIFGGPVFVVTFFAAFVYSRSLNTTMKLLKKSEQKKIKVA